MVSGFVNSDLQSLYGFSLSEFGLPVVYISYDVYMWCYNNGYINYAAHWHSNYCYQNWLHFGAIFIGYNMNE